MAVAAYILILAEPGRAADVAAAAARVEGVERAEDVTGPYDVIVRAAARDMDALGRLVVSELQTIDGVDRTVTCPVVTL